MKMRFNGSLLSAMLLFPAVLAFDSPAGYSYGSGSRVWLEGTSTVRGFTCEAGRIDGGVTGERAATIADLQSAVQAANLAIPVATLDCGNRTMNGHMYKALEVEDHPFINYRHSSHQVAANGAVTMNGTLTIAGGSQQVRLTGQVTEQSAGVMKVAGRYELKMTDYGVRPPTLMMGTMKVHDPVTVHYELMLRP